MPRVRVLIADDHTLVAHGLQEILRGTFDVVGVVHDGRAMLDAVVQFHPDVIVADISMPVLNGIEAARQVRDRHPDVKVVILTMHNEVATAVSALRAGARGYILKTAPDEEFILAISEVAKGNYYVSPSVTGDPLSLIVEASRKASRDGTRLTPRQREVLQLIAEGRTMKEVASTLNISPRTAETHKYEIMRLLEVESTAHLVQHAIRAGIAGI